MIYWNQLSGNNVNVTGFDRSGHPKSPGYNPNMGFHGGELVELLFSRFFFCFFG